MNSLNGIRLCRYVNPIMLINQNKIEQINFYLSNHDLQQFYSAIKNFDQNQWIYCKNKQHFQFCIISTYKTFVKKQFLNYSIQHYKQMLKILEEKYFNCLHALLSTVHADFPLYSQFVELMFKYMLDDEIKLSDCIAQTCSLDIEKFQFDYQKFLQNTNDMIVYCKNKQLAYEFKNIVQNKILHFIKNKEKIKISPLLERCDLYYFFR